MHENAPQDKDLNAARAGVGIGIAAKLMRDASARVWRRGSNSRRGAS
jgi:hypothetical protein